MKLPTNLIKMKEKVECKGNQHAKLKYWLYPEIEQRE